MRRAAETFLAFFLMSFLFAAVAWSFGFTPRYDEWRDGDHPTNWYDTALHPGAN